MQPAVVLEITFGSHPVQGLGRFKNRLRGSFCQQNVVQLHGRRPFVQFVDGYFFDAVQGLIQQVVFVLI